jgi:hypothetical protein
VKIYILTIPKKNIYAPPFQNVLENIPVSKPTTTNM